MATTSKKVAELRGLIEPNPSAASVAQLWEKWNDQRWGKLQEWQELRNYLFATDTTTTTNSTLPWKNKTTLPKLTQIRDNLHANYIATLLPNDNWLKWEAFTRKDSFRKKAQVIESYISNKMRDSDARTTLSQLLYDYIDYGNAFSDVEYIHETYTDPETEELVTVYTGPRIVRISPYDIVFNPLASSFKESPNIVRSIKTIGDLEKQVETMPDSEVDKSMIDKIKKDRVNMKGFSVEDMNKAFGYQIDGFGNLRDYYDSGLIEVLVFEGDFYDPEEEKLYESQQITVIDRNYILRRRKIPNWFGKTSKSHVAWRLRPDNIWGMGPLDNLVGMQYRIDHLENLKADVFDLIAHPPLKIIGQVDDFTWGPNEEIHIIDGDVQMLVPDTTALNADTQVQILENKMEEFAGAPRQAMGIRTPGEKTAFEVQTLHNNASRIFQEKIRTFEVGLLEPTLNSMLEMARRKLNTTDILRVVDNDIGAVQFIEITKEDITGKGKIRPVGARHFAEEAQVIQSLTTLANSNLLPMVQNHISGKRLAQLLEDTINIGKYDLVQENIAIHEQAESQRLIQQVQEDLATEQATSPTGESPQGSPSPRVGQEAMQQVSEGRG